MSSTTAHSGGTQPGSAPSRPAEPDSAQAGGTAQEGGQETGSADPGAQIDSARERIDALDEQIVALVQERMAHSAGIQRSRIESGGRRVHLAREMEVLDHYRAALGRPGTQLAMTLLGLCRGRF